MDDASPENLRKFLNSDDPAMARMGISMAKATGIKVTFKDLEHFLSKDIEIAKEGVALMKEADIPALEILDGLIQNLGITVDRRPTGSYVAFAKETDEPRYDLLELLPTFGKIALKPLFDISMTSYEYASWDSVGEKIGQVAMKALSEIREPETVDYLGSMLSIQWPDDQGTPNWDACCSAASFLEDFAPNPKIGDMAAEEYMYHVKDEENHSSRYSYDKHHEIGIGDLMAQLTSLIESNGLDGLDSSSFQSGQIHETLETLFSGYCYECCRWVRPKMVPGWEEDEEVEGCPLCEGELEC